MRHTREQVLNCMCCWLQSQWSESQIKPEIWADTLTINSCLLMCCFKPTTFVGWIWNFSDSKEAYCIQKSCSVLRHSRFDRVSGASLNNIFCCLVSSTILNSSSIVSLVQRLILPNQLVFGLPLAQAPGVVPWIISFSKHLFFLLSMSFSVALLI